MWVLAGIVAGFALPIQTVINTRLRGATGTPLSSSLISFLVGTAALTVAVLIDADPLPRLSWLTDYPAWLMTGGFLGVVLLTGNIVLFPRLGAVQTVILPVTGQVIAGLAIDHFGAFGAPQTPMSWTRVVGLVLVLAGLLGAVGAVGMGRTSSSTSSSPTAPHAARRGALPWQVGGVAIGTLGACQSAINGQLGLRVGSALSAALVSFAVGALTLAVVNLALRWRPRVERGPWWMWTGGVLGAVFVFANAALVPVLGTGVTVVATLIGLLACGLIIDRVRGTSVSPTQLVGLLILGAGVAVIRLL